MFIDVAHVKGCGTVARIKKKKTAVEVALRTTNHSLSPCTASEKERERERESERVHHGSFCFFLLLKLVQ